MLREDFPCLAVWDLTILASDLSEEKLERARRGRYSQAEVNRGMPVSLLVKSFHRDGLHWTIDEPTRRSIHFAPIDLADAWPSSGDFDLIALRNVLSDLDAETRRSTLSRLTRVLAPDGYLWLGSSEPLDEVDDHFERVLPDHGNFYRLRSPWSTLPVDLALL